MTGENTGDNPRRVLLKLSGEAFGGGKVGIDTTVVRRIAEEIVPAVKQGVQVAIVVGGGNFFRGAELQQAGIDRSRGDYMGMLGTVMNCLALQDFLEQEGQATQNPRVHETKREDHRTARRQIGRASCRERVCQYV